MLGILGRYSKVYAASRISKRCPPQPILLIHQGLLDSTSKPFFFQS
jgi:hypothetical protein